MSLVSKDITQLLVQWSNGDDTALEMLTPLVYEELRRLAGGYMSHERSSHTLRKTALVHEAYLELRSLRNIPWKNKSHFIGEIAIKMRHILVDHARKHNASKRGGGESPVSFSEIDCIPGEKANQRRIDIETKEVDIVAIHEALTKMEVPYTRQCRVVELKFFADLSNEEVAEILDVGTATVERDWRFAKAWLHKEMTRQKDELNDMGSD